MPDEMIVRTGDPRKLTTGESRTSAAALQPVAIQPSRLKLSLTLGIIAPVFAMGVGAMVTGRALFAPLILTISLGVLGFTLIREILDHRPRITIDETGVHDRGNRFGRIEWNDITGAYRGGLLNRSIIYLQVRNPAKYNDRLSPLQLLLRQGATSRLPLSVSGTQGNAEEIVELIEAEVRARWAARAGVAT